MTFLTPIAFIAGKGATARDHAPGVVLSAMLAALISSSGCASSSSGAPDGGGSAGAGGSGASAGGTATGGAGGSGASAGSSATSGAGGSEPGTSGAGSTGGADASGGTGASGGSSSGTGGAATGGSRGTPGMDCDPELTQSNKALVDQAIEELFVAGDITAVDRYWADPYLQHNPIAESGVEAFRNIFGGIVSPGMPIYEPVRTIGECDLVLIHGNYTGLTGPMFDMFRIQDNRLVEHWDAGPVGPGPNASGHTALDGPSEVQTPELGAENKALVLAFTQDVLIGGNTGEAGTYLSETLVEHSPGGEDGSAAFMEYRASEAIVYSEVHHVIADGNFAFTMSEGSLGGDAYGFYDLYRIANGLIAEHWDGRREVPATTASGLGIF